MATRLNPGDPLPDWYTGPDPRVSAPRAPAQPPADDWFSQNAPTPPAQTAPAPTAPAAPGATPAPTTPTAPAGGGGNLEAEITAYQQTHPYSPASYQGLFDHLKSKGFNVERPTRAGGTAMSDDKIVGPDGKMYDLITGVDGGNPQWAGATHIPGEYWFNGKRVQNTAELGPGGGGPEFAWGANGLPVGYSQGQFTGGGQYPLASVMGPGLMSPFSAAFQDPGDFRRPGVEEMKADPGYQARLDAGLQGIERSAAAKGTLRNPGTMKDLNSWAQDYAANEYANTYGRAMGENEMAYNRAWNEYQGAYNIYDRNQANQFNRLQSVAGMGQNAANQSGYLGQNYGRTLGDNAERGANIDADEIARKGGQDASYWRDIIAAGQSGYNAWDENRKKTTTPGTTPTTTPKPTSTTASTTPKPTVPATTPPYAPASS